MIKDRRYNELDIFLGEGNNYHFIYKIVNKITSLSYVGKRTSTLLPSEDNYYGTTSDKDLAKDLRSNSHNYYFEVLKFYSSANEARNGESLFLRSIHKEDRINYYNKHFFDASKFHSLKARVKAVKSRKTGKGYSTNHLNTKEVRDLSDLGRMKKCEVYDLNCNLIYSSDSINDVKLKFELTTDYINRNNHPQYIFIVPKKLQNVNFELSKKLTHSKIFLYEKEELKYCFRSQKGKTEWIKSNGSNNLNTLTELKKYKMKIKYDLISPKIEVLGRFNTVEEAWKRSRPHLSGEDMNLHEVNDLDLPVHGFGMYSLNITGSFAVRELFFMLRPQPGAWAISNRTKDLKRSDLQISTEVPEEDRNEVSNLFDEFIRMKEVDKIPQDLCKDILPYGTVTNFSFVIDKRTLSNVVKNMKIGYPILYDFYGKRLEELIPELVSSPGGAWILDDLNITSSDMKALNEGPVKMGRLNIVGGKIQGVLLSQFIRKIYDKVASNIISDIKNGSIYSKPQTSEYDTVMYLPDSSLAKMQSTRTCAFAKFDKEDNSSWSYVLKVEHLTNDEFKEQLPCGGCADKCAFRKEQLPRLIAGNNIEYASKGEVNPPCAIQTGIKGTHIVRGMKFGSKSKIFDKWTSMLNDMGEMEITEDGKEYLKNVELYGFAEDSDNIPEVRNIYLDLLKGIK